MTFDICVLEIRSCDAIAYSCVGGGFLRSTMCGDLEQVTGLLGLILVRVALYKDLCCVARFAGLSKCTSLVDVAHFHQNRFCVHEINEGLLRGVSSLKSQSRHMP